MMVDVAAIFDEVFGPEDRSKGLSENGCARCVGVLGGHKPLENNNIINTPTANKRHTQKQGVLNAALGCANNTVKKQHVTAKDTPAHRAHPFLDIPLQPVDPDAFEERAAIIHDAHAIADDGALLPKPICTLSRQAAETLAAQEQGHADAGDFRTAVVARWSADIGRLVRLRAVSPDGATALKSAQAFIGEGWALQAARLGWDEVHYSGSARANLGCDSTEKVWRWLAPSRPSSKMLWPMLAGFADTGRRSTMTMARCRSGNWNRPTRRAEAMQHDAAHPGTFSPTVADVDWAEAKQQAAVERLFDDLIKARP